MTVYSAWRGQLRKLTEVYNDCEKTPYLGSRSSKVIEFVTNRKGMCDFQLVVNSNLAVSRTVSELRRLIGQNVTI